MISLVYHICLRHLWLDGAYSIFLSSRKDAALFALG